jgi:hypothetical protein
MKKASLLLLIFISLTAFTCENEPLDPNVDITADACNETSINLATAALNFVSVTPENYTQLCISYRNAIQNQINVCGDPDGSLQDSLTALGDCSISEPAPNDCPEATALTAAAQTAFSNAIDTNYTALCNAYQTALENQISLCGDSDGSLQILIDGLGNCIQSTGNTADGHALMTANLDGEQFNNMVPFGYYFTNNAVGITTHPNITDRYLRIQGTNTPNQLTDFTKEINIFIPESLWSVGTYELFDYYNDGTTARAYFNIIYRDNTSYLQAFEIPGGEINIETFDLVNRVITGTFSFSYTRTNGTDTIGPFECTNGTFDYSLDHSSFD